MHTAPTLNKNIVTSNWLADLLILALVAIVLGLPMLIYGPMIRGHDTLEHLNFSHHFADQFWGGEWYPRWLLSMNHGLGSPTFFVYPPLPSYIVALLRPVGMLFRFSAFRLQEFLALFGSGVTAFLWVRTMVRRRIALGCAMLYMLMPYHLSVDFYRRTALPECWAILWMPLILYFTVNVIRRRRGSVLGLALAFTFLILSHLVSVLIFSLIPLLVALVFSNSGQKLQSVVRVTLGMALGTGLSCFYLLPAVLHSKNFPVSRLFTSYIYDLSSNLVGIAKVPPGTIRTITYTVLDMALFVAICGAATLYEQWSQSKKGTIFWFLTCLVPILLMTKLSFPLWKHTPWLYAGIQFPWRLNILVCVGVLPIAATFLSNPSRITPLYRASAFALLLTIVASWCSAYVQVWSHYKTESYPLTSASVSEDDGWFDAWSPPGMNQQSALDASKGPQARFLNGEGTCQTITWKARHIEIQTSSESGGDVMLNQFYYPSWTAALLGPYAARPLKIDTALPEGLLKVEVPAGSQRIRFDIPVNAPERAGAWISASFALLFIVLCFRLSLYNSPTSIL